jgi:hypothetical protein
VAEGLEEEIPAGIIGDLALMCLAWERVKALARPSHLYLPGHDLLALRRFPGPVEGIAHLK